MPASTLGADPGAPAVLRPGGATTLLLALAAATLLVHWFTGGRYGFHRDELATLDDARHLAWGYVAYPPLTPFLARLSLGLFGTSLAGFRFFASLAEALGVVLTGWMARELGGGRAAQLAAAFADVPLALGSGVLMQYVAFDQLAWMLFAYCTLRLLRSGNGRWWLAIGSAAGFGMMAKYAIPMLAAGLVLGLALGPARRHFRQRWIWCGAGVALLIWAPNLIWEAQHHFITLDFLRHIHARDVAEGRANGFLAGQLKMALLGSALALAGLWFCIRSRQWRPVAWMYLVPLSLMLLVQGRDYYLFAAYPMLYAAGAVWLESHACHLRPRLQFTLWTGVGLALALDIALVAVFTLPLAAPGSALFEHVLRINGDMHEEFGWHELVRTVADIRSQVEAKPGHGVLGILAANYGEAGAINLYGPAYGLPPAISGVNSFWARGYGEPVPQTLIVLGFSAAAASRRFAGCRPAGHTGNPYHVHNEESDNHPDIFVCGPPLQGWPDFWNHFHIYG